MIEIIGLHGKAKSGKDTVADHLVGNHRFTKTAYADHLKDITSVAFGIPRVDMDDQYKKAEYQPRYDMFLREILQKLGTECFRAVFGEDFWLNALKYKIEDAVSAGKTRFVISDVRFDNEAAWIKDQGGTIIHITTDRESEKDIGVVDHKSEKVIDLSLVNYTLENNSTYENLYSNVDHLIHLAKR